MTAPAATPIHCPSCGRCACEAAEVKAQTLRCFNCRAKLAIDLERNHLTVRVEK
jgi:hypothetical protein